MRILLGVTGSIAAYKAADVVRLMRARSWEVRVIMTPSATQFIGELTLRTLSMNPVAVEMFAPAEPDPALAERFGLDGKFVLGYGGIIGYAQALGQVLDAAEMLRDLPEVVFAFFGDGPLKADLAADAERRSLSNVRFLPRQQRGKMPQVIALWDVGLVPLADHPLFASSPLICHRNINTC